MFSLKKLLTFERRQAVSQTFRKEPNGVKQIATGA
jgi:hypothetical protein